MAPKRTEQALLSNIPKRAPAWSIGVATVLVAVATAFVTMYMVSKDEVKTYVSSHIQQDEASFKGLEERYNATLKTVLALVSTNSSQIADLSKSLAETQQQNIELSSRVSYLEKQLAVAMASLEACEKKLKEKR